MTLPSSPVWLCNIGNTNTSIAYWDGTQILERSSIPTVTFGSDISCFPGEDNIVVCSVVQTAFARLHSAYAEQLAVERLHVLGSTSPLPFESVYAAGQAGADRLANIAGCLALELAPCVAVDAGTAITIDYIDPSGLFAGGAIMPGLQMSIDALHGRTDALPLIDTPDNVSYPALNTVDAIAAGVTIQATAAIEQIAKKTHCKRIVLTGGSAPTLLRVLPSTITQEPDLTFIGMLHWYQFLSDRENLPV